MPRISSCNGPIEPHFLDKMEATPLVVDGVMYMVEKDELVALDAATGRQFWAYHRTSNPKARACCEKIGRGLAFLGNTVYWGTIDAFLIAIDARDGKQLWQTEVANTEDGVHISLAPIAAKDKIILGLASSEMGGRCFMAAFDAKTGKEVWRFDTVPKPGEPGNETWGNNSWEHGGAPMWTTGTYDPELNLTYWGTGNPVPGWNSVVRPGDNLYSDSVIALDVDTGKLKWYYQFTPGDPFDHDATQVPVLVDAKWQGQPRKLLFFANRNGFYYVIDRVTGKFLLGKAFVKQNWNRVLTRTVSQSLTLTSRIPASKVSTLSLALRAAPTGTRLPIVRKRDCCTFRPGTIRGTTPLPGPLFM